MKRMLFYAIMLVILLSCMELGAFLLIYLVNIGVSKMDVVGVLLDDSVEFTDQEVNAYFETRHPVLGWPSTKALASEGYDRAGARPNPSYPENEPPCAAAFGDSFTYSSYVDDDKAWPYQLSKKMGCYVVNYGVGGYGTDQAYLRYTLTDVETASIVILGLFPENIQRNINQYRGFLEARHELVFKPRFILSDDKLQHIPIIDRDGFDFESIKNTPDTYFKHEYFLPDTKYGPISVRFPYSLTAFKALIHPRTISFLSKEPTWIDLYEQGHESNALQVTGNILQEFVSQTRNKGKTPIIYVFTTASSVKTFAKTGKWPYQTILDFMENNELPYIHIGDSLSKYIDLDDICTIYDTSHFLGCTGHFTDEGYEIVADSLYKYIVENNLLPNTGAETRAQTR